MRLIISGSRDIENYDFVVKLIESCPFLSEATEIIHGGCPKGVDQIADRWAKKNGFTPIVMQAEWTKFGNSAGPKRNAKMAEHAAQNGNGGAIIIQKNKSKGSQSMLELAQKYNLKIHHVEVKDKEVFSLAQLKELQIQLEGKQFVGGELSRKLIAQQIKQLEEYQAVIRDTKIMWAALADVEYYIDTEYLEDPEVVSKALMTPTAKFIEALYNANNKQNS